MNPIANGRVIPAKLAEPAVGVHAQGAQIIRPETLQNLTYNDRARLTDALRDLHLDVDIHPMSFSRQISSEQKQKGLDDVRAAKRARVETMEEMQWLMHIQMMKMLYRSDVDDDD